MKISRVALLFPLVYVLGCGGAPDLKGQWNLVMGPTSMQIEFGPDGKYSGTMTGMGGAGQVSGSYTLKGKILEMDPPTVTGPGGSASPGGGKMRVKLISQGPNMYLLDAGNQKFPMTRIGPGK